MKLKNLQNLLDLIRRLEGEDVEIILGSDTKRYELNDGYFIDGGCCIISLVSLSSPEKELQLEYEKLEKTRKSWLDMLEEHKKLLLEIRNYDQEV